MKQNQPDRPIPKYSELVDELQKGFQADAAFILLIGGTSGTGCSIKTKPECGVDIPNTLRTIADQLERDIVLQRTLGPKKEDN